MFVTDPIGIIGEEKAAEIISSKGYKVVEHNWRLGHLEVDLIAESRKEIVFIEVKARTSTFGSRLPEEFVDSDKQRRMQIAANAYIKQHKLEKTPRFDVFGILVDPKTNEVTYCNHIEGCMHPQVRTTSSGSCSGSWKWIHRNKTIRNKRS